MADPQAGPSRIPAADLLAFACDALRACGLPTGAAGLVADTLVDADARGIASHGIVRLPIYVKRLRSGLVDAAAVPTVNAGGAVAIVDARNCVGALAARSGMEAAIDLASHLGVGIALVRQSNHCGALGFYVRDAARRGFVAIGTSNAPVTMAYHGGRTRAVGTNPLAIAVPRREGPPLVLDVATSAVARGKIIVAASEGRPIPAGWAIDVDGDPTTDADRALEGSVLPFAGPKGSGLAMMIDLLCGVVAGADFGRHVGDMYGDWTRPQNVGHVFLAIRPGGDPGSFLARIESFIDDVAALPPAAGNERVLLPGEVEEMAAAEASRAGVPVARSTVAALAALAADLRLEPPGALVLDGPQSGANPASKETP
jgi:LDH2 family malate/lactate/ureidoglycolate dehydrogenase